MNNPDWAKKLGVWQPQEETVESWYNSLDNAQTRRLHEYIVLKTGQPIRKMVPFEELPLEKQMAIAMIYEEMTPEQHETVMFPAERQTIIQPLDNLEKLP
jgi:hypothetical protein